MIAAICDGTSFGSTLESAAVSGTSLVYTAAAQKGGNLDQEPSLLTTTQTGIVTSYVSGRHRS
jgi:hypothetical protein